MQGPTNAPGPFDQYIAPFCNLHRAFESTTAQIRGRADVIRYRFAWQPAALIFRLQADKPRNQGTCHVTLAALRLCGWRFSKLYILPVADSVGN